MAGVKVKSEHSKKEFGFNNKYAALGDRDDNHILLMAAKANNNKSVIDLFEDISDEDLQKIKEDAFNKKQAAKAAAAKQKEQEKQAAEKPTATTNKAVAPAKKTTDK